MEYHFNLAPQRINEKPIFSTARQVVALRAKSVSVITPLKFGHPFKSKALALVLGTEPKLRIRLRRTLSAALAFSLVLLGQVWLAAMGMADQQLSAVLAIFIFVTLNCFYVAIRSGWSLRYTDPALTLPQMVFGIATLAIAYAINPPVRGLVPMLMTLVLGFGSFILPSDRCKQLGYFSVIALTTISIICASNSPLEYQPRVEAFNVVLSAIALISMGHLSGQLSSLRIKQKEQALALQAAVQEMQQMATHDDLTALPNRRYLTEQLTKALLSFQRHPGNGSVLYIDIDNFQGFNDMHGHTYGDELLQHVARRLMETLRAEDTLVRFGGDEFVVMLLNLEGDSQEVINQSKMVAEKVLRSFHEPIELSNVHYQCTASIGVAQFGQGSISADDVLKRADLALYQAKNGGRNTFRFFDPEIQALVIARTEMEAHMRRGIVQNEFLLHYQPQVDEARTIIGVEALVRWQHPQWGMVSPANFIPLAEDTGLIMPLGAWVLETACQQIKLWSQDPKSTIQSVSVNVSASQFLDANFVALVLSALGKAQAPASMLKLELTESMLVTDAQTIIEKMGSLREHGIGFSMDDFGTGYSSLAYLRKLPLDQLKIDQSFLKEALTNQKDAAIVRVIIALGTSLGMKVIAEGVETREQCDLLLREGCNHFQGYLFGRPVLASGIHFG